MSKKSAARTIDGQDTIRFSRAAREYIRSATASRKKARAALVKLGTHTKKGNLTKNYK